ncbi:Uncharacterized protein FKW44_019899, partial [Caligus rogercresseyi]
MELLYWIAPLILSLSSLEFVSSLGTAGSLNVSIYSPCAFGWLGLFSVLLLPWSSKAEDAPTEKPFESCRRVKDCPGECYRHYNRRRVTSGSVWIPRSSVTLMKNVGIGSAYFDGIKTFPCTTDDGCKVSLEEGLGKMAEKQSDLLLGEFCCIDVSGATEFQTSKPNWNKICCDNSKGAPIVQIPSDISDEDLIKIDKQISRMGPLQK